MTNAYYNHTTFPATGSQGSSALARAEFDAITSGFNLLPTPTGNPGKFVIINAGATGMAVSSTIADSTGTIVVTGNQTISGTLGVTGAITGNLTGNSSTATALQTARTINGVSFNGTANITINAVDSTARVAVAGDTMTGDLRVNTRIGVGLAPSVPLEVAGKAALTVPNSAVDLSYSLSITTVAAVALGFNNSGSGNAFGAPSGVAYAGSAQAVPLIFLTSGTERGRFDTAGNFGVGLTSPGAKIHSAGFIASGATGVSDGQYQLRRSLDGVVVGALTADNSASTITLSSGYETIVFKGSTLERARFDTSGRFGVGRTPASNIIEAQGVIKAFGAAGGDVGVSAESTGVIEIRMGTNNSGSTNTYGATTGSVYLGTAQGADLVITTAATERVRFGSTGRVGVGRTATTFPVEIQGITKTFGAASSDVYVSTEATGVLEVRSGVNTSGSNNALGVPTASVYLGTAQNASLALVTNSAARLFVTGDGRFYGTALHNNAGSVTGTTNQYISSGTYTPTLVNVTNISSSSVNGTFKWIRVGNVVYVHGSVNITPTAAASTKLGIPLPIASNLANADGDLVGTANATSGANPVQGLSADAVNDRANYDFVATATVLNTHRLVFSYEVL